VPWAGHHLLDDRLHLDQRGSLQASNSSSSHSRAVLHPSMGQGLLPWDGGPRTKVMVPEGLELAAQHSACLVKTLLVALGHQHLLPAGSQMSISVHTRTRSSQTWALQHLTQLRDLEMKEALARCL